MELAQSRYFNEFFGGVRDELPILLGVAPFGMIYGVLALAAGLPPMTAQAMSAVVFAGSAQFMVVQLIGAGTPMIVLFLTGVIINLRHALYSASLAPHLRSLSPAWKAILSYLLTDEAYVVTITHYNQPGADQNRHWYFLGAGLTLWTTWQASTAVGIFLGAQVPSSWSLDFTLALTFIALLVPSIKDRAGFVVAVSAGLVAVLAAGLPYKLGLLLAALIGILVGVLSESKNG